MGQEGSPSQPIRSSAPGPGRGARAPVGHWRWVSAWLSPALLCQPALHVVRPRLSPLPDLQFYFPANTTLPGRPSPHLSGQACAWRLRCAGTRSPQGLPALGLTARFWARGLRPASVGASLPGTGHSPVLPLCQLLPGADPLAPLGAWAAATAHSLPSCFPGTQLQGGSVTRRQILRRESGD